MSTVYYRIEDPIENLKIRVVVREIAKSKIYNDDGTKVQPFYNEMVLAWQQKLYSPGEISDFLRQKDNRNATAAQVEARRHFAKLQREGESVRDMLEEVMMYTYVDKDNFKQDKPPPLHEPGTQEPYLGAAVRTLGGIEKGLPRQKSLAHRLFRDKPFKSMYICLATDIDGQRLSEPASFWVQDKQHYSEHILCSIKLYQDGLMEVSPSFSGIIEETSAALTHTQHSSTALSAFIDDQTAESGIKHGFRLASFRLRSLKGSEYEYIIQNMNDLLIPYKIEQIEAKKSFLNSIKSIEVKENVNNSNLWSQNPPSRDKIVGFYGEIVSGKGFNEEKLFLTYEITTPSAWELRLGCMKDSTTTTTSSSNGNNVNKNNSMEQNEIKHMDNLHQKDSSVGMLHGITHTALASSSNMHIHTNLSCKRPKWSGMQLSFPAGVGTRIILGSSFFLLTCLSVIVGLSYPIWILPALVILFVLNTGPPASPPQIVLVKHKSHTSNATTANSKNYKIRSNYDSYNNQDRQVVGELEPPLVAVFNHLFRCSFDVNEAVGNHIQAPSMNQPTIVFQVYSTNWFGRHRLEGYGYHHLSDQPGHCEVEIRTWKPIGSIHDQMEDFFLGNAMYLKDEHFVNTVNHHNTATTASALNKFGVLTQSSGCIKLRLQTIITDPRTIEDHHRETAEIQLQQDSSMKVKRTVNDILRSFRASNPGTPGGGSSTRLSLSRSSSNTGLGITGNVGIASLTPTGKSRPSVMDIMSSLNSTARDAKVNEIIARARAKTGKVGMKSTENTLAATRGAHGVSRGSSSHMNGTSEKLTKQLPISNFNTESAVAPSNSTAPAAASERQAREPSTPTGLAHNDSTGVDTPYASERSSAAFQPQGSGPAREQIRPKNVPVLGSLGHGASSTGRPVMAPLSSAGSSGRSSTGTAASSRHSAHTGRSSSGAAAVHGPTEDNETPRTGASAVPASARKHRYAGHVPSDDEGDAAATQSLLGDNAGGMTPTAMRGSMENDQRTSGIAASQDSAVGFLDQDDEEPEDAPLLATLQK